MKVRDLNLQKVNNSTDPLRKVLKFSLKLSGVFLRHSWTFQKKWMFMGMMKNRVIQMSNKMRRRNKKSSKMRKKGLKVRVKTVAAVEILMKRKRKIVMNKKKNNKKKKSSRI